MSEGRTDLDELSQEIRHLEMASWPTIHYETGNLDNNLREILTMQGVQVRALINVSLHLNAIARMMKPEYVAKAILDTPISLQNLGAVAIDKDSVSE